MSKTRFLTVQGSWQTFGWPWQTLTPVCCPLAPCSAGTAPVLCPPAPMAMTGSTKPDDVVPVSDQVVAVPVMAQATLLENAATTKANGKSCTCVKGIHIAQMTLGILYLLNGVTCFLPSPFLGGETPWQFGIIHCLLGAFAIYASTLFNPCGCCTDPKPGQAKIISIASALSALMAVLHHRRRSNHRTGQRQPLGQGWHHGEVYVLPCGVYLRHGCLQQQETRL